MTASRDPDRLVHAFLDEGLDELPDPVYDAVRDRIEQTRQRAFIGSWRTSDMNRYLQIGLVAAAAAVIAVVGLQFLGNSNTGGPGATETPQPTATPAVTPEPSVLAPGEIAAGPFLLWGPSDDLLVRVTIPAPGWYGETGQSSLIKEDNADPPGGLGMSGPWIGPAYVFGDACHWETTQPETPVGTVAEFVAAIAAQASRDAAVPVDVTMGGYAGKEITLQVPDDAVFDDCDQNMLGSWVPQKLASDPTPLQGPGQTDILWIFDVNGRVLVFDARYYAGTPADHVSELRAIMDSITFD